MKVENVKFQRAEDIKEDSYETPSLSLKFPDRLSLFFDKHKSKNLFKA